MSRQYARRLLPSPGGIFILTASLVLLCVALPAPAAGAAADSDADAFPTSAAEALAFYESAIDSWADGPVEYLMLVEEKAAWKQLTSREEKERFIRWFWERRDEDLRVEGNAFRQDFYERVALANRRFRGLPRGWESDRGRVWVILGRPDNIRSGPSLDLSVWTYHTAGRDRGFGSTLGEVTIGFRQTGPASHRILGDFGAGVWPYYVLRAFAFTREAVLVNQDLEFHSTG